MSFLNNVKLEPYGESFITVSMLYYYSPMMRRTFAVPVDFITDLASVPTALHWFVDSFGKHTNAAVLHDYLYSRGIVSREDADAIFLEALTSLGVGRFKRGMMWLAVRLFGGWKR